MGKKEREKGARGERMLKEFLNNLGLAVKRGYVFLKQSDLVDLPGIHIECKFVEKLNVRNAMYQAIEEAKALGKTIDLPNFIAHRDPVRYGVIDTMEDMICNTVGGFIGWVILKFVPYHHMDRKKAKVNK